MTDFTDIIKAQDRADEVLNANKAMINDGVESPNIPESAAQSVLLTEHPAQYEKTWEDMGRGEQIVQSLEFGYNNMKMAKAASEFMDANEASKIGLSAFADDIDGMDEESQKAVEALLAKDTAVNRQYKEEQADRAMASAYEYADLLRESTKFRAPSDLAKMQEAAKGKGFWEGLFDAGKVFFDGDVIGNSIYLAGTSFGAMAPYIVMATVGNKAAALTGMSAVGGAIAGAFMGVGSYQNEYGSYIADALKEKGYDLSDPESWRKALSDQARIDDLKYRASNRAMGVSVFDAIAGHASALHFRPATALRSLRKAEKNAPSFGVRVVDNAGNMTTQMAIQGALGGAGEAVGSLAAGDEVDPSAVFMEMVGELTGAPSEVLTIGVSSVNEYREDIQRVQEAKSVAKIAEQFTAAAEAVGMSLKNEEAIDAWAERVGDDKNMIAFGQDVVEQVNMQELEDVDPQLAEQVKEASEAKRSVEISVARITKIATKNRNLANALIRESKVRVDGMSPREAEEFEKTGKAEAEAQFDKILARSKGTRQQLAEAREVAADLSRQLQEAGTSKEVADLQVKPWEMMLANAARMLGTSPKDMAKRMNLRIERSEDGRSSIEFTQKEADNSGEQQFLAEAKDWAEYIDGLTEAPTTPSLMLKHTPLVMQLIGADDLPIYVNNHVLDGAFKREDRRKDQHRHLEISKEILKAIPMAMADPIAIYKDDDPHHVGDLLFMLDLKDKKTGSTIVVSVQLKKAIGYNKKSFYHAVVTSFGKTLPIKAKDNEPVVDNQWFIDHRNDLEYLDRKKIGQWNTSSGTNPLWVLSIDLSGKSVRSEEDLRKLRKQKPALYQTAYSGGRAKHTRFDMNKVGSGLGTSVQGWGMYASSTLGVAERYREDAVRRHEGEYSAKITVDGTPIDDRKYNEAEQVFFEHAAEYFLENPKEAKDLTPEAINKAKDHIVDSFKQSNKDFEEKIAELREKGGEEERIGRLETALARRKRQIDGIESYVSELIKSKTPVEIDVPGRTFTIDIPDNELLLDWDKPIAEQTETVKKAIKDIASALLSSHDITLEETANSIVEDIGFGSRSIVKSIGQYGNVSQEYILNEIVRDFTTRMLNGEIQSIEAAAGFYTTEALGTKGATLKDTSKESLLDSLNDELGLLADVQPEYVQPDAHDVVYLERDITRLLNNIQNKVEVLLPAFALPEDTGKSYYERLVDYVTERDQLRTSEGKKGASLELNKYGIQGIKYADDSDYTVDEYVGGDRGFVIFNDEAIEILEFWQDRRGSYTPFNTSTNTYGQAGVITLMQESDKSTFLHESSHVWLDFHTRLATDIADKFDRGEQLTAGEQEFLRTLGGFFKWGQQEGKISLGVDDTPESVMRAVRSWANLSIDEQRGMHELFADGFERYLIDGNSPSPEVASIFKRFASWLKKVYATAMRMPNPISPEVKKLYDLLFISEQEAADAEVRAGMVAMFAADDAKAAMTDEERKQYADLNEEATLDAQGYVRKAVSGVMRVYTRLRQKEAERIYREHKERIDIRTEELMEEPRFIALDILTVGLKQKEGERIRMKLNADVLRMEGYSQETINALAEKGFVYDGRDHHDFISPKALAAQAGASDIVQLVKDLVNKKRAKAHSPLARAREMLTWGGSATKLNVRELTALGIDNDTIAELLVNDYAVDPAQVAQTGSAQQLAELCGHGNAVGLIGELLEIEPARMEATKEVHAQILQETGEKPEVYTQLQADLAAHNATRSRLLHAEHNAIARMLGKKQLMVKAAREYALQKIQSMRFAEVAPYIFVRDEKRCARLAEQAYIKGDFESCLEYKRAQILNMEMARAALELQNSYEKAVRHARAAVKSKTIHKPYQKLATLLIAKHDLAGTRGADIQGLENELGELLSEMAEGGTPVEGVVDVNPETGKAIPGALLLDTKRVKDMTVEEAQNLFDALRELVSVGRNIQKQTLLETKARVREVVSEGRELLAETAKVQGREPKVEEVPKGFWEKKLDWAKGFFVDHIKIATWCRIFDQNKENGFFWNLFIRSANKCANFESTERARVATELDKILTPIFGKKGAFDQDKIQIGKRLMSKGERFAVACNLGNDSNRERLVAGQPEQWTDETIEALCSSLSEAEWRAAQSVWSLFESYRPLIAAKQKRVYGEEPKWIERKPLTVTTADGKTITLHGGYYPVKYDPRSDLQVQVRDDASVAAAELRGAFQSSTTNRSFTKQRTAKPNGKRLRLDMQAMFEGLDDVIHDLAWHEWLIDTRRILVGVNGIGSGLQTTIKDLYGSHVARAFDSWRQDIAQGDRVPPGLWSGISGNVGVVAMGWNPMSALVQLTGVGYIVPRCGARNTLWALKKFMTNPRQARKTINAASKMMANRALTMNKNVAQIKGKLEAGRTNWVKENAYCMIIAVQGIVDTINWMAAYAKAMQDESVLNSENPDETAVAVADQIVIDTQGSGSTNDLAKVERDPRFDMFTVFYSWANAALNNSVALAKGETNRAKAMRDLLFMAVFMPTLEKIFRESLKAGDEEDEEDKVEELVMLPLKATVEYHLGMFVFARELSGAASSAVAGEPVYTYGGTAGTQGISAAVNLIGSASDPTSKRFLNASLDVTGAMLGLPTGQIKKTIKGIQAVESGQAEGLDAIKAPIFGYSGRVY